MAEKGHIQNNTKTNGDYLCHTFSENSGIFTCIQYENSGGEWPYYQFG
jgi:hypothetical protein